MRALQSINVSCSAASVCKYLPADGGEAEAAWA